ncbi:MAG: DUF1016 family protein [Bacteroidetes bacterium]|nr:MAG: DUF1016 family protein [Bacteroidota bacterium]TAG88417.1 MAG: DUF1016 family protein [Bacteroidota bacterium]
MGRYIVEYEQKGKIKAEYGKKILIQLAKDLKIQYDKGFSRSYLVYIRLFYIRYPKSETLFHQLSWSQTYTLFINHKQKKCHKNKSLQQWKNK